jgi:hypothetical protein
MANFQRSQSVALALEPLGFVAMKGMGGAKKPCLSP